MQGGVGSRCTCCLALAFLVVGVLAAVPEPEDAGV